MGIGSDQGGLNGGFVVLGCSQTLQLGPGDYQAVVSESFFCLIRFLAVVVQAVCQGSAVASKVAMAVGMAKDFGIRKAVELKVAGAFHSRLMEPAYERLGKVLADTHIAEPRFPVVCNVDAKPVSTPDDIRRTLADQVTDSVRWADCVTCLLDDLGCDTFLELGPGTTLAGMVARIRKGTTVFSVGTPADLEKLAL